MKIEIKILNDNDEVLIKGEAKDFINAEGELERLARAWHKNIEDGLICEECENTGKVWLNVGSFDDAEKATCYHVQREKAELSAEKD